MKVQCCKVDQRTTEWAHQKGEPDGRRHTMPAQHKTKPAPVTRRTRHRHFRQALIGMDDAKRGIILCDRTACHGATDQIIAFSRAPARSGAKLFIKATQRQHQLAWQEQVEFNHAGPDIGQVNRA